MGVGFSYTVYGAAEVLDWLSRLDDTLRAPRGGLIAATRAVAERWQANFSNEGGDYKKWQALAEATQRDRERHGYSPDHPILRRAGALNTVAIGFFLNAPENGGGDSGNRIAASFDVGDQEVELSIGGPKAANQNGRGKLPARPFWFTNEKTTNAASQALSAWLEEQLS